MDKFFSPKTIAIVGASAKPGKTGHEVLKNIINDKFSGEIYPINPHEVIILEKPTYKSLGETPKLAELVIIVIPATLVHGVIKDGAALGIKNFVIITAGFGETGEDGAILDAKLEELIEKYDLHVMGPNCLGVISPYSKLNASFGGGIPQTGNVALLSQSGAIISSLCDWSGIRNFGFSKIVSLGNKLQLDENECLKYLENDENTKVIVLFLKHFCDKKVFLDLCTSIGKQKTIILYKSGIESMNDEILKQELEMAGVLQAKTLEDLYNLTHICSALPIPQGSSVSVITNAGGPGTIANDIIQNSSILEFANFSEKVKNELIAMLPQEALPANPLDLIGDARANLYSASLDIVLKNDATDSLVVILSPQAMTQAKESAAAIATAQQKYPNTPIVACFLGGTSVQNGIELLLENSIPCFLDPARAIWAIEMLTFIGASQTK
jgi:acetate---CoA ligase (ADP-forming)